ncbi:Uncharacterised protein [Propionibacterium australiense]|uniref:Uncharacterized protein n=1 Tax=Propionibacterium australiense TaxID=119981 RepID=A0A383S4E0_9ACTN|nr:Protein of unknown function DUF3995 [Propionibacterium australiense]VEH91056.1 Uncharacterised protein [Propionibacterium australiense]
MSNYPAVCVAVWWSVFGAISLYWALGGNWLVDTAVQEQGLELARERPPWVVVLVLSTAVAKFALALFGVLVARPNSLPIRRWMYGAFGLLIGVSLAAYGLASSRFGLLQVWGMPKLTGCGGSGSVWGKNGHIL